LPALSRRWHYRSIRQTGSHIVLETEEPPITASPFQPTALFELARSTQFCELCRPTKA
jgi:hypothetical protein